MTLTQETTETTAVAPRPREETRTSLVAALHAFAELGYEFGFNGHVTARDSENPDWFWANPFGVSLHEIELDDLVLLDSTGEDVLNPRGHRVNGFQGNVGIHLAHPQTHAVVHLHTPAGFVWSSTGRPLEPLTSDAALVTPLQALFSDFGRRDADGTPVSSPALAFGRTATVLLQRTHGFITRGASVDEAAFYLVAAERAAQVNLAAAGVPGVEGLSEEDAARWALTPALAEQHFAPYRQHGLRLAGLSGPTR